MIVNRCTRRQALAGAAVLAPLLMPGAAGAMTPRQPRGPYYPRPTQIALRPGALRDNDLTLVPGVPGEALGEHLLVTGRVETPGGQVVAGARVEIWQANAEGRYLSTRDRRRRRDHDPSFQYWGTCTADRFGRYAFRTIVPPAYPSGVIPGWVRPPHIHVRVMAPGLPEFVTQIYWDDPRDPHRRRHARLLRNDVLLWGLRADRRALLVGAVEPTAHAVVPALGLHTAGAERHLAFPLVLDPELFLD